MTQFVWFTGHSAVGKQRTINQCIADSAWMEATFGLDGGQGVRQLQVSRISEEALRDVSGCNLLKWQNATNDAICRLREFRPDARHVVILLRRETQEHLNGFLEKFQSMFKNDPVQLAIYTDPKTASEKFFSDRAINEQNASSNRILADVYLEFRIENGRYERMK